MADTVSDFLVNRLREWGIDRVFGFPGDGINGVMGALGRADDHPRFIQARHEELAAFMACAHAKFTGKVGVCISTSGPGAIHMLNGLYDAKLDHQPVVAIMGQQKRMSLGSFYQQEVDLLTMCKDVASDYVQQIDHAAAARHIIDTAIRVALARRTVTCVIVPADVQELEAETPPRKHGAVFSTTGYEPPVIIPTDRQLKQAADVLNSGSKVAMLVGAGALNATDEVIETADTLGAGVAKALLGKAALPDDLPFVTGSIGLLGTKPSDEMMRDCDTLLMVGTAFPYSEFLPKEGQARGVQIDIEARYLGLRYPTEVNLQGDAATTLRALLPHLDYKKDRKWRQTIEDNMKDWWKLLEKHANNPANPINPQRVFHELSPRLPDNVILCADSGSSTNWWARDLKIRRGMMASLSGNLATMGPGMPYAVAAKFAYPDRPVLATVGDGAMQMNGNNVLVTIARHFHEWPNKQLIICVLNNGDLNQVTWEQRVMAGDAKFDASQNVPPFPYARYADDLGLKGIFVNRPDDIAGAWEQAFAADRPCLVEFVTDPEVPPLPPHIKFEQAVHFWQAVYKGDPHGWRMVKNAVREMWDSYAPSGS